MQVFAVNSVVSFGRRRDKKETLMLPTAVVGAAGGAIWANQSKINLDKDSYEKSFKIIDEKLDKTFDLQERFEALREKINFYQEKLKKLGIKENMTEVSTDDLLKGYVDNESKDLAGLNKDIEFVEGKKNYLLAEKEKGTIPKERIKELENDIKYVEERKFIRELVENAKEGKVKVQDVRAFISKQIKDDKAISEEMRNFSHIVHSFNKKRIWLFAAIGFVVGGAIGHLFKIEAKRK